MSKQTDRWKDAYTPQAFAEKHGMTVQQARIVISSNGPSRHSCDVGALAFLNALTMRKARPHLQARGRHSVSSNVAEIPPAPSIKA